MELPKNTPQWMHDYYLAHLEESGALSPEQKAPTEQQEKPSPSVALASIPPPPMCTPPLPDMPPPPDIPPPPVANGAANSLIPTSSLLPPPPPLSPPLSSVEDHRSRLKLGFVLSALKEFEEEKKAQRQKVLLRLNHRTKYASRSMIPREQKFINPLIGMGGTAREKVEQEQHYAENQGSNSTTTEDRNMTESPTDAGKKSSQNATSSGKLSESFISKRLRKSQSHDLVGFQQRSPPEKDVKPRRRSPSSQAIRKLSCHLERPQGVGISQDSSDVCGSKSSYCSVHRSKTMGRIRLQDSRGESFVISSDSSDDEGSDDESYHIQKYSTTNHAQRHEVEMRESQEATVTVSLNRFTSSSVGDVSGCGGRGVTTPTKTAPRAKYSLAPPPVPPPPCAIALKEECQKAA